MNADGARDISVPSDPTLRSPVSRVLVASILGAAVSVVVVVGMLIFLYLLPGTACHTMFKDAVRAMAQGEGSFRHYLAGTTPSLLRQHAACEIWEDIVALTGGVIAGTLVSLRLARGMTLAGVLGGLLPGVLFMVLVWRSAELDGGLWRTICIGGVAWLIAVGYSRKRGRESERTRRSQPAS